MESQGANRNLVRINVDDAMVAVLREKSGSEVTLEKLEKLADKCLVFSALADIRTRLQNGKGSF